MHKTIHAVPKINIFLRIMGQREDGFHNIETIFVPLNSPFDTITLTSSDKKGISLECSSSEIPLDKHNLCWRAAEKFANFANVKPAWKICLEKRIPVAAGLGGGSSDGAAVLKLLQQEYPFVSKKDLETIASELGADVSFFLNPRPSIGRGKGEILSPIKLERELHFVIVNPGFPVSSAWAYKNNMKKAEPAPDLNEILKCLNGKDIKKLSAMLHNDLSPALFRKFPILEMIKTSMLEAGAPAVEITGSGPTLFALAESKSRAEKICLKIRELYKEPVICFAAAALNPEFNQDEPFGSG